jgi:hypothetical protein
MNPPLVPEQFATDGVAWVRGLVPEPMLGVMNEVMRARAAQVMTALGQRPIGIGSRNGYREVVQRSPGRFDVPMQEQDLQPIWGAQGSLAADVPWLGLIRAVLGPDARPSFCGVVFSRPGSPAQQWHIDSPHEAAEHRPPHAVNVLVALADIPLAAGPTEIAPGTHRLTNHLRRAWLDRDTLLYQSATERVTPGSLSQPGQPDEVATHPVAQPMTAGDCLVFDDRILHRGLANASTGERWVAYFSYLRPRPNLDEIPDTHFEATRSLFEREVTS